MKLGMKLGMAWEMDIINNIELEILNSVTLTVVKNGRQSYVKKAVTTEFWNL